MLLSAAIDGFVRTLRVRGFAVNTLTNYGRDLRQLREHIVSSIGREPQAEEVTRDMIRAHLAELKGRLLAPSSVQRHRDAIASFWKWAAASYPIENPMRKMLKPRSVHRKRPRVLSPSQIEAIINADLKPTRGCRWLKQRNLRDRTLCEVFYSAGIRVGEAVGLDWRDIVREDELLIRHAKGGQERIVFLTEPAQDALAKLKKVRLASYFNGPIFTNYSRGGRLTTRAVEVIIHERSQRAGIEQRVYPHLWRHSLASIAMERNVGIHNIAEMLGHKRFSTTAMYMQPSAEFLQKQIALHPRNDPIREAEEMKLERQERLVDFENTREATLNNCDEPLDDDLVVSPPTLRDLARECAPDEAAQLIALASKFDDLIAQLQALKSQERALVANISFVGATTREVKEARRSLRALRRLAA